ncbi:MAG: NRDE family protein [Pseudomonadales bacterium]
MCLVLFSYDPQSNQPLVVAANRDEFYARPAMSAHFWEDQPGLLAGRDLSAGGTWLGVSRSGRFATVTNFAEEGPSEAPLSRGRLPESFLAGTEGAQQFAHGLHGISYRGFNLLIWDGARLVYTSNYGHTQELQAGVYGLANAELGATWPKVVRGRSALAKAVAAGADPDILIQLLADRSTPPDELLPKRGRPLELERRVAPCFIAGDDYGTRASTAVVFERAPSTAAEGGGLRVRLAEQAYGPGGVAGERCSFELQLPQATSC